MKRNPIATVATGDSEPVVVLHRIEPVFYCAPEKEYEAMMDNLKDQELITLCEERENDHFFKVSLDDL
ncbi:MULTISPECIES: plasmid stabilization protein [unclassified Pseudomonas]|uniref:plasmid stabilization protein n=1 Tax=unclassified Pseudomonas TaxID=196821 RepID=UPI002A3632EB|nr:MULTISPECIES: plasmid stabilization protein [unclassified Pseudomonas]MDX9668866.1 plasmid stabilization protein [Pseudomonas sp. P8_250]WPN37078.1 plasmid stabilization protein [Pseudomonas sp. P8_139]WPN41121.1 plasmid stabilization protein [Pseudomonas sp. P8_229]